MKVIGIDEGWRVIVTSAGDAGMVFSRSLPTAVPELVPLADGTAGDQAATVAKLQELCVYARSEPARNRRDLP